MTVDDPIGDERRAVERELARLDYEREAAARRVKARLLGSAADKQRHAPYFADHVGTAAPPGPNCAAWFADRVDAAVYAALSSSTRG